MDLKTYIQDDRGRATHLAEQLGVSRSYVSQMASGASPISAERCVAIEQITDGLVTRRDLRPDDWASIWPELRAVAAGERRRKDDVAHAPAAQADGAMHQQV